MQLTLPDVAQLFEVSEATVSHWVEDDNLPTALVNSQYRFDRAELLEWATLRKIRFSPRVFHEVNGDHVGEVSLSEALRRGGIAYQVQGSEKRAILRSIIEGLPVPNGFDHDLLLQLFLAREKMGTTAVGDGIAIPHPRTPVLLPVDGAAVRLSFLAKSLDFGAPDGKPVSIVFALVCPTMHEHLQLLARLSLVLREPGFREMLNATPQEDNIHAEIKRVEDSF